MFSTAVTAHWLAGLAPADLPTTPGTYRVVVDADLPAARRLSVLDLAGTGGVVRATPEVVAALGLDDGGTVEAAALSSARTSAGVALNGADHVFHLPAAALAALTTPTPGDDVRVLTAADADAFAAFAAAAPEDDLDEAYVELDHWLVVGAFVAGADGPRLVSAASAYPWAGTTLADTGVLTLPEHRGRGLGRRSVRALAAHAHARGHEPLYRCQLDNAASVALARAAGFVPFATWDVVRPDDD
ncbi:GNAT family N-acetyltransferase [Cellulomonas iranensis]|uniref:GNAT family N-acetyltransferase n=1 Tax=Cellulomonas iranensis TaxID=76862 RepID=UPI001CF29320|nr:GNAT family N-acetyltransferase [Cellulomonas iranensis]UCN14243.1 GNAT family N-acetyltransferase [Cellulomonas iranensis]